jgi:hypothetical protein
MTSCRSRVATVLPLPIAIFTGADVAGLYTMIREYRPRRVVEVGSGSSTRVILSALDDNGVGDLVTVEPFETYRMPRKPTYSVPVQQLPMSVFDALESNDILFIDSSHVVAIGSDVTHVVLRILHRLKPGVLVHFHDIFLPDEYPQSWVVKEHRFWTEQYVVHAFLLFNSEFEVLWSSHYLSSRHAEALAAWSQSEAGLFQPASFWMRRKARQSEGSPDRSTREMLGGPSRNV